MDFSKAPNGKGEGASKADKAAQLNLKDWDELQVIARRLIKRAEKNGVTLPDPDDGITGLARIMVLLNIFSQSVPNIDSKALHGVIKQLAAVVTQEASCDE